MLQKLLKSVVVIFCTTAVSVLLGIICVGRSFGTVLPARFASSVVPGIVVTSVGLLLSIASSVFILRYFIFFTRTRVLDRSGNTISDNRTLTIGSVSMPPLLVAAIGVILSIVLIGAGLGLTLDNVTMYIVFLSAIALLLLSVALVVFLFSVIRHKIRRRFAWITSGLLGLIALIMIFMAVPAIRDLSVKDSELSAITATVLDSSYQGVFSGPGKSIVRIKGTSGEIITLRFSGSRRTFRVGNKYTFYYLPHTHLIKKVYSAENVIYD